MVCNWSLIPKDWIAIVQAFFRQCRLPVAWYCVGRRLHSQIFLMTDPYWVCIAVFLG